jgi:hypothetical protein
MTGLETAFFLLGAITTPDEWGLVLPVLFSFAMTLVLSNKQVM